MNLATKICALALMGLATGAHAAERASPVRITPAAAAGAGTGGVMPPASRSPSKGSQASASVPAVIQAMIDQGSGVKLLERFPTVGGLTGYVLSANTGERRIFYVTPDRAHAILGLVFDASLSNLTAQHQIDHIDVSGVARRKLPEPKIPELAGSMDASSTLMPLVAYSEGQGLDVFVLVDLGSASARPLARQLRAHLHHLRLNWIAVSLDASGANSPSTPQALGTLKTIKTIKTLTALTLAKSQQEKKKVFDAALVQDAVPVKHAESERATAFTPATHEKTSSDVSGSSGLSGDSLLAADKLKRASEQMLQIRRHLPSLALPLVLYHDVNDRMHLSSWIDSAALKAMTGLGQEMTDLRKSRGPKQP